VIGDSSLVIAGDGIARATFRKSAQADLHFLSKFEIILYTWTMTTDGVERLNNISKSTRELYSNIRSELTGIHYRVTLVRQLFASRDINDLLNKTAIRFFTTLKWDLMNTIAIAISRLTDPAKSFNKFENASLKQIIDSLDSGTYPELIHSLTDIFAQIKAKSSRIENWRKKWVAHRDFDVVQGHAPMPATSLSEIDEVLSLIGKFVNEFERVCQDPKIEINLNDHPLTAEEFDEMERLKINQPLPYENRRFLPDDDNTIIELIKRANSSSNQG
jgi:hypothetical protein